MSGLRLAITYGFPPSKLGFCGPKNNQSLQVLAKFMAGQNSLAPEVRAILSQFKAAYHYYQLIARTNQITDPFNQKVVAAYWLGNKLLDQVPASAFKKTIISSFSEPGLLEKKATQKIIKNLPENIKPHHSAHVFFIGSITGVIKFDLKVRNQCLVKWGQVKKIGPQELTIAYRPLKKTDGQYYFDKIQQGEIKWERPWLSAVKTGGWVSFHWGRACQVISESEKNRLRKYTTINLQAVNSSVARRTPKESS
jgi:hypothetical protein